MTATFWWVAAVIAALWLVSFTWHLFARDWMPSVPAVAGWHLFRDRIHRLRKGANHESNHPCGEVGDA